jgi:hypothetical protein
MKTYRRPTPKAPKQRYRVIQDNDGHDYIIPAGREDDFYMWVAAAENNWKVLKAPKLDFEPMRVNSTRWTFTDPQDY